MKTSQGYTDKREALAAGKHVVFHRSNPAADGHYVAFSNKKDARRFALTAGLNDPSGSPRLAKFVCACCAE